jgi:hypothetical protein
MNEGIHGDGGIHEVRLPCRPLLAEGVAPLSLATWRTVFPFSSMLLRGEALRPLLGEEASLLSEDEILLLAPLLVEIPTRFVDSSSARGAACLDGPLAEAVAFFASISARRAAFLENLPAEVVSFLYSAIAGRIGLVDGAEVGRVGFGGTPVIGVMVVGVDILDFSSAGRLVFIFLDTPPAGRVVLLNDPPAAVGRLVAGFAFLEVPTAGTVGLGNAPPAVERRVAGIAFLEVPPAGTVGLVDATPAATVAFADTPLVVLVGFIGAPAAGALAWMGTPPNGGIVVGVASFDVSPAGKIGLVDTSESGRVAFVGAPRVGAVAFLDTPLEGMVAGCMFAGFRLWDDPC